VSATWRRSPGRSTADWYREFAEREVADVSPTYQALCSGVADDAEICGRLDTLPEPKRQPNLLLATVRYLGGPVESWPAFRSFVLDRWDELAATMRERRTQTNEARRCAAFLPVLAALPQPLALLEVGASAGLCLYPDRWSYAYSTPETVHRVGRGPELRCATTGPVPLPQELPRVVWRAGLDLNPLDVTDDDDVRWLESLIWPEQTDRFEILREAVAIAQSEPPRIDRGDLTADLAVLAAEAPWDATLVVFHTAVLAYVAEPAREGFLEAVHALESTARTTCWLANEAPGVVPGTEQFADDGRRFVVSRDQKPVALAGGHGHTLDWLAEQSSA
jgi:hypothetical protein